MDAKVYTFWNNHVLESEAKTQVLFSSVCEKWSVLQKPRFINGFLFQMAKESEKNFIAKRTKKHGERT